MPWTTADVDEHMKGLSPSEKETWVTVANKALADCDSGDCDAKAIKQANTVVGKVREALAPREEDFVEAATFKALMQGLIRSAGGVATHKNVPKAIKAELGKLRSLLGKAYKDVVGEEGGGEGTQAATEATNDTSDGSEEFAETGKIVEVANG